MKAEITEGTQYIVCIVYKILYESLTKASDGEMSGSRGGDCALGGAPSLHQDKTVF